VSKYPQYTTKPYLYSGERVMEKFFEHLADEEIKISEILSQENDMLPLTHEEKFHHKRATCCPLCENEFNKDEDGFRVDNKKVHHHDHITGQYIGPYCNKCNLKLKQRQSQSALTHDIQQSYHIPVIAHNMKSYDMHHILKYMTKDMLQAADETTKRIHIIPSNSEKYISLQIGGLRFIDSLQFLPASLENLVANLAKDGHEKFIHTQKHLPDTDLVYAKGVYPYEYMTDISKFDETNLPQKKHFYSKLNNEDITDADYKHAKSVWNFFNCSTLQDYHDVYLKSDVLLLADVFESFRSMAISTYRLDPAHYYTLPGFSWDACLLKTRVKLDLFTDPEMHLFLENAIRGGISTITHRYAKANNPLLDDYDPALSTSYLMYLDCNNLYGDAMTKPLPTGDFHFLPEAEVDLFDVDNMDNIMDEDLEKGYILEVDLEYPPELHDLHNDYPLAAERLTVSKEMLSPYCNSFGKKHINCPKLVPNLNDKTKYVIHYKNLQLYRKLGLKLTRIHRVLEFTQSRWMAEYIDFNTSMRALAKTDFEKDFFKLLNNSVFGKTMENVRNRVNIRLIGDETAFTKAVAKPTFQYFVRITDDLVIVKNARASLKMNKPIYVGFCVLELSKERMYDFHYNQIVKQYNGNAKLLFTDTDSLCYIIRTEDIYDDMSKNIYEYDTSAYDAGHALFSNMNKKVVGKFKDETNGKPPVEFVGLRAKMYSLLVSKNEPPKMTAKGIKKGFIRQNVRHEMFLDTLRNKTTTTARFNSIRSKNHTLRTVEVNKACLSAYDDKRYILEDGMSTLAYGHYKINPLKRKSLSQGERQNKACKL
jgi:hypothetical protein